jgi:TATA-box binding protein (TBP) (component of TFIID and TFIIIB)
VYAHPEFASYEPELFPGLIYRYAAHYQSFTKLDSS